MSWVVHSGLDALVKRPASTGPPVTELGVEFDRQVLGHDVVMLD